MPCLSCATQHLLWPVPWDRTGAKTMTAMPLPGQDMLVQSTRATRRLSKAFSALLFGERGWRNSASFPTMPVGFLGQLRLQHFLYFLPDPQGQGAFRPTFP